MSSAYTSLVNAQCLVGTGVALLAIPFCIHIFRRRLQSACERQKHNGADMSRLDRLLMAFYPWLPVFLLPKCAVSRAEIPISAMRKSEGVPRAQGVKQSYDAFLVLDVEGTCVDGRQGGFGYPNEIIEWPVCLLRWKDKDRRGLARELEVVDEFRSFVKPTWRPQLSQFCINLTGITQEQIDCAPTFGVATQTFRTFLERNGLIEPETSEPLVRFVWCTDGPWDIRDFVVKQCFLSKIPMPVWIPGEVLDVRLAVRQWHEYGVKGAPASKKAPSQLAFPVSKQMSLSITDQLRLLDLSPFEGRQHSGIDDTRNVARILTELARRGIKLQPNTAINPKKRWPWMGKHGKVREGYY